MPAAHDAFANTLPYEITSCNGSSVPVDRLARIRTRTPPLAGGTSPDWAGEGARTIAATVPGARWRVLDDQGHGAADEVLVPVLTDFVDGSAGAG